MKVSCNFQSTTFTMASLMVASLGGGIGQTDAFDLFQFASPEDKLELLEMFPDPRLDDKPRPVLSLAQLHEKWDREEEAIRKQEELYDKYIYEIYDITPKKQKRREREDREADERRDRRNRLAGRHWLVKGAPVPTTGKEYFEWLNQLIDSEREDPDIRFEEDEQNDDDDKYYDDYNQDKEQQETRSAALPNEGNDGPSPPFSRNDNILQSDDDDEDVKKDSEQSDEALPAAVENAENQVDKGSSRLDMNDEHGIGDGASGVSPVINETNDANDKHENTQPGAIMIAIYVAAAAVLVTATVQIIAFADKLRRIIGRNPAWLPL